MKETAIKKPSIRQRQKELTLSLLKAAARKVFYERPFDAVSVEDIANEAGVSRGTVYLHFASKRDILWDMLMDDMRSQRGLYERLSEIPVADRRAIRRWLQEYRADFDARRKSMDLFPLLLGNTNQDVVVLHRDEAIACLGRRFAAFRLEGLAPAAAARRRAIAHMLLYQIEQTVLYFSASEHAPDIDLGLDLLTDQIQAFIEAGE